MGILEWNKQISCDFKQYLMLIICFSKVLRLSVDITHKDKCKIQVNESERTIYGCN